MLVSGDCRNSATFGVLAVFVKGIVLKKDGVRVVVLAGEVAIAVAHVRGRGKSSKSGASCSDVVEVAV